MNLLAQYDNPKLWVLVSSERGKDYVSVTAPVPEVWERIPGHADRDPVVHKSGEYEIRGHKHGHGTRRSYTVWRQGVELPLSLTGLLRDAKKRAMKNARGEDRMHVA